MAPPDTRPDVRAARLRALDERRVLAEDASTPAHRALDRGFAFDESFLAHFLRAPSLVGGIVPSSRVLARTLSRHAAGFDAIVELGAGAGSVTRWLATDHPRATLTVVERDAGMARTRLARGWPRARVHAGCVHDLAERVLAQPPRAVAVSSLPFRSPCSGPRASDDRGDRALPARAFRAPAGPVQLAAAPFEFMSPLAWCARSASGATSRRRSSGQGAPVPRVAG